VTIPVLLLFATDKSCQMINRHQNNIHIDVLTFYKLML